MKACLKAQLIIHIILTVSERKRFRGLRLPTTVSTVRRYGYSVPPKTLQALLRLTAFNCVFKLDRRQPAWFSSLLNTVILVIRCKLLGVTEYEPVFYKYKSGSGGSFYVGNESARIVFFHSFLNSSVELNGFDNGVLYRLCKINRHFLFVL